METERGLSVAHAIGQIYTRIQMVRSWGTRLIEFVMILSTTIVTMLFFDDIFDLLGNTAWPSLFSALFYPVDVAGFIEYTVGFGLLTVSIRKHSYGVFVGVIFCIILSFFFLLQKLGF